MSNAPVNNIPLPQAQNPLAELRDIHLPEPVSWWPLAPGWWIAAVLTIIAITLLIRWLINHQRRNRYRKEAVAALNYCFASNDPNQPVTETQVTETLTVLRRSYLTAYGTAPVQSVGDFIEQLDSTLPQPLFGRELAERLALLAYAPAPQSLNNDEASRFRQSAKQWLAKHPRKLTTTLQSPARSPKP